MAFDPEIHHRRSIRLKGYDYSLDGAYFITICIKDREHLLGKVIDEKMIMNMTGEMVRKIWMEIPENYPGFKIDHFVVMPNHFHGIILIQNNSDNPDVGVGSPNPDITTNEIKTNMVNDRGGETPPLQKKFTLSEIIAYFKYASTCEINSIQGTPGKKLWQRGFYDRIIRNDNELDFYRYYTETNPENWEEDEYFV